MQNATAVCIVARNTRQSHKTPNQSAVPAASFVRAVVQRRARTANIVSLGSLPSPATHWRKHPTKSQNHSGHQSFAIITHRPKCSHTHLSASRSKATERPFRTSHPWPVPVKVPVQAPVQVEVQVTIQVTVKVPITVPFCKLPQLVFVASLPLSWVVPAIVTVITRAWSQQACLGPRTPASLKASPTSMQDPSTGEGVGQGELLA
ncbi:hypothetical protein HPB51_029282 [Rhipicephalus microplus]|uniref:Uncharacterized protein n=1 Tax=Rhipicephalus microplus TaxID=6941 RepID=A0A9J6CV01_RHIMP|nr:hypothetical protein HPB51_029282 [Rhipicephalus microplus]